MEVVAPAWRQFRSRKAWNCRHAIDRPLDNQANFIQAGKRFKAVPVSDSGLSPGLPFNLTRRLSVAGAPAHSPPPVSTGQRASASSINRESICRPINLAGRFAADAFQSILILACRESFYSIRPVFFVLPVSPFAVRE